MKRPRISNRKSFLGSMDSTRETTRPAVLAFCSTVFRSNVNASRLSNGTATYSGEVFVDDDDHTIVFHQTPSHLWLSRGVRTIERRLCAFRLISSVTVNANASLASRIPRTMKECTRCMGRKEPVSASVEGRRWQKSNNEKGNTTRA